MSRHAAIRSSLFAILALFAGQRLVLELTANEAVPSSLNTPAGIPGRSDLTFFAAPEWAAPADHIAIPVLGVDPRALRDNFLGRRGTRVHHAIDIMAPRGTPVVAAVDGTIMRIYSSGAGGKTIYLADRSGATVYYYAHLDRYAAVAEKQAVRKGEILGYVGSTGNAPASAPHLHFAIDRLKTPLQLRGGTPVNPYPILTSSGVTYRFEGGELTANRPFASMR